MPAAKSNARKNKIQKRKRAKARAKQPSRHAPTQGSTAADDAHDQSTSAEAALEYLQKWRDREEGDWKFSKKRQSHLLRCWPDPTRLPRAAFELLIPYAATMHVAAQEKAVEQARKVASEAETELTELEQRAEDDVEEGDAERVAILKIRLMRALKVVASLGEGGGHEEDGAEEHDLEVRREGEGEESEGDAVSGSDSEGEG
jgi:hypothetical protein